MKYIKTFENYVNVGIDADIEEICYDITDSDGFSIDISTNSETSNYRFLCIKKYVEHEEGYEDADFDDLGGEEFYFNEIKEVCLRIKDYLGEKFIDICDDRNRSFDVDVDDNRLVDSVNITYKIN